MVLGTQTQLQIQFCQSIIFSIVNISGNPLTLWYNQWFPGEVFQYLQNQWSLATKTNCMSNQLCRSSSIHICRCTGCKVCLALVVIVFIVK